MNRNYFNVFLYGALALSTATFVGCKDYDDDIDNLQEQIDKLNSSATTLNSSLESLKSSLQSDLASQKSSLETQIAQAKSNLQTAIDSKASAADVTALAQKVADLTTDLAAKESALQAQIDAANAAIDALKAANKDEELQAAIEEANATIAALTGKVTDLEAAAESLKAADATLAAADATLQANIDAVNKSLEIQAAALEAFQKKVEDADYQSQINDLLNQVKALGSTDEAIKAQIADLQKLVSDNNDAQSAKLATEIAALKTTIEAQIAANTAKISTNAADIAANEKKISELQAEIAKLKTLLGGSDSEVAAALSVSEQLLQNTQKISDNETAIAALKESMTKANENISNSLTSEVNTLTLFINRALSSVTLVPELYINGIEAIEFKSLMYFPMKFDKTSGKLVPVNAKDPIIVNNGETTATYRLSPNTVTEKSFDIDNISFVGVQATARETRSILADNKVPVAFNGAKFSKGLLTVKLKKTVTSSLNLADDQIYTVALRVPRTADYNVDGETSEVFSEYSRLSEKTISPVIAALPYKSTAALHNYSDSTAIWGSKVDNNELITKEQLYTETLDLRTLVTGCYQDQFGSGSHHEITKAELKEYGLAFRFAIPTTPYKNAVDNSTDQQTFAALTDGYNLQSKLPADLKYEGNQAVVGKEPIVRVTLLDTVNNKLVDQRYLKIKWTLKKLDDVTLPGKESTAVLNCNTMSASLTWKEFVTNIYAKALPEGLSQLKFEQIYPYANITVDDVKFAAGTTGAAFVYVPGATGNGPVFKNTTNDEGDALIATWTLTPSDVKTIYNSSASDTKTVTATVTFNSTIPSEYANLKMNWTFTIKLPTLPSINGYYDQYWIDKYTLHDVMPVQYNTAAQTLGYCVYNNNLMNAFTYSNNGDGFIVKDIPECGTWDMQFALSQPISTAKVGYTGTEPDKDKEPYATFPAYLLNNNSAKALVINWDEGHTSWCGNPLHKSAYLFADHNNAANQPLLNPLSDENESDGITPKRTHDKKVKIGIWATLNEWNYIPVAKYDITLVAPLRIDSKLKGHFEEGLVSGSTIDCSNAFTLTDFRGYEVAKAAPAANEKNEFKKYTDKLYKYYEVSDPEWDLDNVTYGMKIVNGNIVIDNNLTAAQGLTASAIKKETNGNIVLSITQSGNTMTFKNNGGSNVEAECNVFIPVKIKYGFGELTKNIQVKLYPKGQVPANAD